MLTVSEYCHRSVWWLCLSLASKFSLLCMKLILNLPVLFCWTLLVPNMNYVSCSRFTKLLSHRSACCFSFLFVLKTILFTRLNFMRHLTLHSFLQCFTVDSIFFGQLEAPTKWFWAACYQKLGWFLIVFLFSGTQGLWVKHRLSPPTWLSWFLFLRSGNTKNCDSDGDPCLLVSELYLCSTRSNFTAVL